MGDPTDMPSYFHALDGTGTLMHAALKQSTFLSSAPPVMGSAGVLGLSDEDENMTRAIAASMESNGAMPSSHDAYIENPSDFVFVDDDDDIDVAILEKVAAFERASATGDAAAAALAISSSSESLHATAATGVNAIAPVATAEDTQAQAAARLPAVPTAGTAGACKVAIRLPSTNARAIREFMPTDTVQTLYDFAVTLLPVEDVLRPFVLGLPMGGMALEDRSATLHDVNAAGGMFLVKWI